MKVIIFVFVSLLTINSLANWPSEMPCKYEDLYKKVIRDIENYNGEPCLGEICHSKNIKISRMLVGDVGLNDKHIWEWTNLRLYFSFDVIFEGRAGGGSLAGVYTFNSDCSLKSRGRSEISLLKSND